LTTEEHKKLYEGELRARKDAELFPYRMDVGGGKQFKLTEGMAGKYKALNLANAIRYKTEYDLSKGRTPKVEDVKTYRKGEDAAYWVGETPEHLKDWNVEAVTKGTTTKAAEITKKKYAPDFLGGLSLAWDKTKGFVGGVNKNPIVKDVKEFAVKGYDWAKSDFKGDEDIQKLKGGTKKVISKAKKGISATKKGYDWAKGELSQDSDILKLGSTWNKGLTFLEKDFFMKGREGYVWAEQKAKEWKPQPIVKQPSFLKGVDPYKSFREQTKTQAVGMAQAGKFVTGGAAGITEDIRLKPYKLPLYYATGASLGKFVMPVLAKLPAASKLAGYGLGGAWVAGIGVETTMTPPGIEREKKVGVRMAEMAAFVGGAKYGMSTTKGGKATDFLKGLAKEKPPTTKVKQYYKWEEIKVDVKSPIKHITHLPKGKKITVIKPSEYVSSEYRINIPRPTVAVTKSMPYESTKSFSTFLKGTQYTTIKKGDFFLRSMTTTKQVPYKVEMPGLGARRVSPEMYTQYLSNMGKLKPLEYLPKDSKYGGTFTWRNEGLPKIAISQDLKYGEFPQLRQQTIAHELIHYKTPTGLFKLQYKFKLPYYSRPSEIIAFSFQSRMAKIGFKVKPQYRLLTKDVSTTVSKVYQNDKLLKILKYKTKPMILSTEPIKVFETKTTGKLPEYRIDLHKKLMTSKVVSLKEPPGFASWTKKEYMPYGHGTANIQQQLEAFTIKTKQIPYKKYKTTFTYQDGKPVGWDIASTQYRFVEHPVKPEKIVTVKTGKTLKVVTPVTSRTIQKTWIDQTGIINWAKPAKWYEIRHKQHGLLYSTPKETKVSQTNWDSLISNLDKFNQQAAMESRTKKTSLLKKKLSSSVTNIQNFLTPKAMSKIVKPIKYTSTIPKASTVSSIMLAPKESVGTIGIIKLGKKLNESFKEKYVSKEKNKYKTIDKVKLKHEYKTILKPKQISKSKEKYKLKQQPVQKLKQDINQLTRHDYIYDMDLRIPTPTPTTFRLDIKNPPEIIVPPPPGIKWPRGKFSPKPYKKKKFKPYHKYQPSLIAGFKKITTKEMPMPKYLTGVGIRPVIRF